MTNKQLMVSIDGGETFVDVGRVMFRVTTPSTHKDPGYPHTVLFTGSLDAEQITVLDDPYGQPSVWHLSSL